MEQDKIIELIGRFGKWQAFRGVNGNGNTGKNVLPLPVTVLPVKNRLLPKNGNNLIWMFLHEIWGKMCKIKGFCKTRSIQWLDFGFWVWILAQNWPSNLVFRVSGKPSCTPYT